MSAGMTRRKTSILRLKWRPLWRQTETATVGKNRSLVTRDSSHWLLVPYPNQVQSIGGSSESRRGDLAGGQARADFFDMHFAERTFHQRAHHQSYHLVKESVAVEVDRDTRTFLADAYRINCTYRALFAFSAIGCESRKVIGAHKVFCR